jgi:hypothetical protein
VNYCPSNLLSGSPPPPPFLCQSTVYKVSEWLRGGGGVESCWRPYYEGVTLCIRLKTYKIARPSQTITFEGRGPQTDKHLPQSTFTGKFFYITTFCIAFSLFFLFYDPDLKPCPICWNRFRIKLTKIRIRIPTITSILTYSVRCVKRKSGDRVKLPC